ncbi:uncharacterized protein [Aquarana catesbeiana]|uniref:uncharacterized protein n=1 Tax=Aquarana catesbeiana TaxID=8400 RepID=UPI003CC9CF1A
MKRTTLTCQIKNFRQSEIQINVYLKRRDEIKKHLMAFWESTDQTSSNNSSNGLSIPGGQRDNNSVVLPVLEEGSERPTVEMKVEMTKSCNGNYKCLCSISITVNEDTDDRALLVVKVKHATLQRPISVYRTLFVYKSDLIVSEIPGDQYIPHMKRTTLTCQITSSRLKEIQINVYLRTTTNMKKTLMASWKPKDRTSSNYPSNDLSTAGGQKDNNPDVLSVLEEGADRRTVLPVEMKAEITKSWFGVDKCLCFITITLNADIDIRALLEVEVEHTSLIRPTSVHKILNVYKNIPLVSDIMGDMWIPQMKKTTLSFQITEFKLKEIHIKLYLKRRNDKEIHFIHSWASVGPPSGEDKAAGHRSGDIIEEDPLLEDTVNDTMLPVEMEVEMTETEDGSYKCDCRISLTPNADTDGGAILVVKVTHATLPLPLYRCHILNVIKGDTPSLWRRWRIWRRWRQSMHFKDRIKMANSMAES